MCHYATILRQTWLIIIFTIVGILSLPGLMMSDAHTASLRISLYHLAGKMSVGSFSPTSALVLYALK